MTLIVKKFGGTSVGSLDRIQRVADVIAAAYAAGESIVVVLSAMGDATDELIAMAKALQKNPEPREYSMLVSTGEQVSVALMSMALQARGVAARSFAGWQAGIYTDGQAKKARIERLACERLEACLSAGIVPVVAGFQGVDDKGDITTLGRGGSDTTAVALAAKLTADECQIFTDVAGVYTADPRVVPSAQLLSEITFEEMMELASLGAKVLQPRAVEFAGKYQVKLRVLSSFSDEHPGTLISYKEKKMEDALVAGIAFNRSEAKLTVLGVPDSPGVASSVLGPISRAKIGIDMVIQNAAEDDTTAFTFTMHRDDYVQAHEILQKIAKDLGAREVVGDEKIAKLSIVGVGMRSHAGIATKMFETLGHEGINIQMISTSEIKVSVVIAEKYLELGVRALHTAFGLDRDPVEETDPK